MGRPTMGISGLPAPPAIPKRAGCWWAGYELTVLSSMRPGDLSNYDCRLPLFDRETQRIQCPVWLWLAHHASPFGLSRAQPCNTRMAKHARRSRRAKTCAVSKRPRHGNSVSIHRREASEGCPADAQTSRLLPVRSAFALPKTSDQRRISIGLTRPDLGLIIAITHSTRSRELAGSTLDGSNTPGGLTP